MERWLRAWALECVAPLADSGGVFNFACVLVAIFAAIAAGSDAVRVEVIHEWAAVQAIILGVVVYVGLCAIRAAFKVLSEEKNAGKWSPNGKFTFADPPRVFFQHVTEADNFRPFEFEMVDAEPGGYVELRIETDGFERFVRTVVMPSGIDREMIEFRLHTAQLSSESYSVIAVPTDKKFSLAVLKTNCKPTIIRVFLLSWSTC
ncbi:MAG TPA: hypothetical protein VIF39_15780 [Hyphomicrobium sp.]